MFVVDSFVVYGVAIMIFAVCGVGIRSFVVCGVGIRCCLSLVPL